MKKHNGGRLVEAPTMHETMNDLPKADRVEIIALLNQRLADAVDLESQAKQAHWNIKGPHFIGLHKLFDEVYEEVGEYVDLIAERAVQLGGVALGTVRVAAERSRLEEYPLDISEGALHVEALAKALSSFGREARLAIGETDDLGDADTSDLFTEVSRGTDKLLWMLEAHMQANR
jgi:starvation-inducible DNA-binding protein